MNEYRERLILDMTLKLDEARMYNRIQLTLSLLWLFEFFYTLLGYGQYNLYYWLIFSTCLIGWYHLGKKYDVAIEEFKELKKEYENTI
jgi:hypothetical protein